MAAHRFWRLCGFEVLGAGALELTELRLYQAAVLCDAAINPTCTFAPDVGSLDLLKDELVTEAVSWNESKRRSPAFSINWDFGGSPVDLSNIQIGSSASPETFPIAVDAMYSDDGVFWIISTISFRIVYPGNFSLTETPSANSNADSFEAQVVMRLPLKTSFADTSNLAKTLTATGNAQVSAEQQLFSENTLKLTGGYISCPASSDFAFGSGDFCIEFSAKKNQNGSNGFDFVVGTDTSNGSATNGWFVELSSNRGLVLANSNTLCISVATVVNDDFWHSWVLSRQASNLRAFKDGVLIGLVSNSAVFLADGEFGVGGNLFSTSYRFNGFIADVRVTKGSARYTADFAPPQNRIDFAYSEFIEVVSGTALYKFEPKAAQSFGQAHEEDSAVKFSAETSTFWDVENGGQGRVSGTVYEKGAPVNTPLRRKVLLLDETSQIVVRQTWSDSVTGAYQFQGIKMGIKYTVLAYDHTGIYRAVIADAQLPGAM